MAKGAFLKKEALTDETLQKIKALNEVAASRGQTLAEMSLAWLLKDDLVTSVIIGASSVTQLAAFMRTVALELGPKGIRANSVNPGIVETKLINNGQFTEEQRQAELKNYPLYHRAL